MNRRWLAATIALTVLAVGCKKDVFDKMEALVDEMCDCKDAECAGAVMTKLDELGEELSKLDKSKISAEDRTRAMAQVKRMTECQTKITGTNSFDKYISKSKTSEARELVKKMYDGARVYYMDAQHAGGSMELLPPQFPEPSAGPTPPLGECCKQGGKCAPRAEHWNDPTWIALQFSVDDPHYYSYQYVGDNQARTFEVMAFGDLDCDGEYSTFKMSGLVDETYADGPAGTSALYRENELE